MISNVEAAMAVARKEVLDHIRTKRLLIVGVLFLLAMLLGVWIGIRFFPTSDLPNDLVVSLILATYFGFFPFINGVAFTSALGIMMSADAIVGEWKDRTLFLTFSKPVSRTAVLTGKVLGALATTLTVYAVVFLLGFLIVLSFVGAPSGESTADLGVGFLIIGVGILPFVGLGVLCSCLFRSPTASFLVAFGMWFLIFPIVGSIGFITRLIQGRGSELFAEGRTDAFVNFFRHLDPRWLMDQGASYMAGGRTLGFNDTQADVNVPLVLLAMAAHTVLYLGLSYWIVNRRDYA